ncbi:unnamed protein product [Rotaria sordida]|uniref:protein-tyrosine-phosphatase n=1 Tax=Rotaria sordida TaxID=392033 RepID=A0A813VWY0_9BILA|nr:unnamed protein product [Rotaria sordida]CAF0843870.1 unnamed protein product [Rotaria sordida]CAF0901763.1 unnamed protein product [Rotaria sordida]CAF0943927.1 unnamed protein product [Rotaria sordida]CAF1001751.1 unnamed protein product [Rotaria sordida]
MSHYLDILSPLFSSPFIRSKSKIQSRNSSVVKNLQVLFDEQLSLPLVKRSSHPDLKRISSKTLASLLDKQTNNILIIDARYPFEYSGGHIISAINIYTENDLRLLFTKLISSSCYPSIIIFHCEFSSERGPRLSRLFRSLDRQYNISNYPHLSFPSIYLLDGGYADFYKHSFCKQYCEPKSYISMYEQQYTQELKIYRHAKKIANGRIITKKLIEQQHQGPIQFCLS